MNNKNFFVWFCFFQLIIVLLKVLLRASLLLKLHGADLISRNWRSGRTGQDSLSVHPEMSHCVPPSPPLPPPLPHLCIVILKVKYLGENCMDNLAMNFEQVWISLPSGFLSDFSNFFPLLLQT